MSFNSKRKENITTVTWKFDKEGKKRQPETETKNSMDIVWTKRKLQNKQQLLFLWIIRLTISLEVTRSQKICYNEVLVMF